MFTTIETCTAMAKSNAQKCLAICAKALPASQRFFFTILSTYKRAVDEPLEAFAECRGGAQWNNAGIFTTRGL